MKKILVTRKLLKENEDKLSELFEVKLNQNDKIYSAQEIIDNSKECDGILSSVTDPINSDTILKLSNSIKIIAKQENRQPVEVALSWLLHKKGITAPIVGPGKLEQLKTLLNSLSLKLSKKQILSLEKPSAYKIVVIGNFFFLSILK